MTLAEMSLSANHPSHAMQHYGKALRLNPVLLEGLRGYATAMSRSGKATHNGESTLTVTQHEPQVLYEQSRAVRDRDLAEDSRRAMELFLHGFLPVNNGGQQPLKIRLLEESGSTESMSYLKSML